MTVAIVDYGLGNIFSVLAAIEAVGLESVVDTDGTRISRCKIVVVPGVAAFGAGMRNLRASGQAEALAAHFLRGDRLIGLCLGAQMFLNESQEDSTVSGLGFVDGISSLLDRSRWTVPNQGWLRVEGRTSESGTLERMRLKGQYFYFSHSFGMEVGPDVEYFATARSGGQEITAAYECGNVMGVQFHPERSGEDGLTFLREILT
jgi:glutamine amidotransferase